MSRMARILLIEDEAPIRANLRRFLQIEGYEVFEAENGVIGLARTRELVPDLIICDVMMPEMDGLGVLAALRADPAIAGIPFVFLTASASSEEVQRGFELGASDYVTKPFNFSDLRAIVAGHLDRKGEA